MCARGARPAGRATERGIQEVVGQAGRAEATRGIACRPARMDRLPRRRFQLSLFNRERRDAGHVDGPDEPGRTDRVAGQRTRSPDRAVVQTMTILALLLLVAGNQPRTPDFVVEDKALVAASPQLSRFLAATTSYTDSDDQPCLQFVGKPVSLSGDAGSKDWLLTTADACGWAASAAPIFVVRSSGDRYELVLESEGYDLTLGKPISKGLRNIAIGRATAAL